MKQLLNAVFAICCAALPCRAGENPPEAEYARLGNAAAAEMLTRFDSMEKPKFQRAYDDYLNDLKIIAETGRAQDNRELFNDLLEMNSEEEFVYSQTEGHIRTGFGQLMRPRSR